jgi:hypothetical protein
MEARIVDTQLKERFVILKGVRRTALWGNGQNGVLVLDLVVEMEHKPVQGKS